MVESLGQYVNGQMSLAYYVEVQMSSTIFKVMITCLGHCVNGQMSSILYYIYIYTTKMSRTICTNDYMSNALCRMDYQMSSELLTKLDFSHNLRSFPTVSSVAAGQCLARCADSRTASAPSQRRRHDVAVTTSPSRRRHLSERRVRAARFPSLLPPLRVLADFQPRMKRDAGRHRPGRAPTAQQVVLQHAGGGLARMVGFL